MKVATFKIFDPTLDDIREISLSQGQQYIIEYGGKSEEGYDYTTEIYTLSKDGVLLSEWHRQAKDCDGPLTQDGERYATEIDAEGKPNWIRGEFEQCDKFAEDMNY